MQDLKGKVALVAPAMTPYERIALAHIAQELLWDPGLIPLASFTAGQRAGILLMLRRLAAEGSAATAGAKASRRASRKPAGQRPRARAPERKKSNQSIAAEIRADAGLKRDLNASDV